MNIIKSFRAARWIRTTNLVLQAILFLTFFIGLNYVAVHYPGSRIDLSGLRSHSLSPETIAYLKRLTEPIHITVTLRKGAEDDDSDEAKAFRDLTKLLREYQFATEGNPKGKVTFECIDVYQRSREAKELGLDGPGPTLVQCGDRRRFVDYGELYKIENKEKKEFLGEQQITSAILNVSDPKKKKIYFLTGHGGKDIDSTNGDRGLSELATNLRIRNFDVATLNLDRTGAIPEDATVIVSPGQTNRYSHTEEELLRQYLTNSTSDRPGRLLLLIPPDLPQNAQLEPTGLEDLLFDWGLRADDVLVRDVDPSNISDTQDLILTAFSDKHPITQPFISNQIKVRFGASRSISINPMRAADESLSAVRLIGTDSKFAWGEIGYRNRNAPYRYDLGIDLPPSRLGFGFAAERVSPKDKNLDYTVRAGKLVVYGCDDFVSNNRLANDGNLMLIISSINWLAGDNGSTNILPRPILKYQLTLSQKELEQLRYSLLFALPLAATLLGLIVYWTRRR
ncbi:MAG: GldG family protein [Nibricoccus sp.]